MSSLTLYTVAAESVNVSIACCAGKPPALVTGTVGTTTESVWSNSDVKVQTTFELDPKPLALSNGSPGLLLNCRSYVPFRTPLARKVLAGPESTCMKNWKFVGFAV